MTKKLYRSNDKRIAGICGGIAEYFNVDPTIIRLAWIVFMLIGGSGILAYVIAAILIPERPSGYAPEEEHKYTDRKVDVGNDDSLQ